LSEVDESLIKYVDDKMSKFIENEKDYQTIIV